MDAVLSAHLPRRIAVIKAPGLRLDFDVTTRRGRTGCRPLGGLAAGTLNEAAPNQALGRPTWPVERQSVGQLAA